MYILYLWAAISLSLAAEANASLKHSHILVATQLTPHWCNDVTLALLFIISGSNQLDFDERHQIQLARFWHLRIVGLISSTSDASRQREPRRLGLAIGHKWLGMLTFVEQGHGQDWVRGHAVAMPRRRQPRQSMGPTNTVVEEVLAAVEDSFASFDKKNLVNTF